MNKLTILLTALLVCADFFAAKGQESDESLLKAVKWEWNDLGRGAQYAWAQFEIFDSVQSIGILRYPASRFRTCIMNEGGAAADSTSALIMRGKGIAGVNASYFNVRTLYPVTFVLDDGKVEGSTDRREYEYRVDGIMTVAHKKKVSIAHCDSLSYLKASKGCREAIAAGPILLVDGEVASDSWPDHRFYHERAPRTVIGNTSDGWIYMIVIDGRFPGQGIGTTILETALITKWLGLDDALNLDGGGSSVLWTRRDGVITHPYDNKKFDHYGQRVVPNVIYIR